ncbi:MAG TPA: ABC transporter permease [Xanthomonadaceae bacterium]|jgi:phospholipid/cholesterol/gamma-HCH transport system permease protein
MTDVLAGDPPSIDVASGQPETLRLGGCWVLAHVARLEDLIARAGQARSVDATAVQRLDSAGATLLNRLLCRLKIGRDALQLNPAHLSLMARIDEVVSTPPPPKRKELGLYAALGRLGFSVQDSIVEIIALIAFMGLTLKTFLKVFSRPARFRLTPTVYHLEIVGLDAVPLVILLSFLVGAVLAFLGANVLQAYGAQIYVVELVSYAFLREFGVLLTAIILAGRTASAFTAQIGAMQNREEIDAIRTLGLDPIELLVIPRLVALLIALPLLTFIAMCSGIIGGAVVSWLALDIPLDLYWSRLNQVIELRHFIVGIVKTPMFATIISLIGCLEGFQTQGTAQSVGERTTSAVVQCISLVIVLDAIAAVFFMEIKL